MVTWNCCRCNELRSADDFYRTRADGVTPTGMCKKCVSMVGAAKYKKNKVEVRFWSLNHRYGLSRADFEAMLEKQGGVCAICEKPPDKSSKWVLHVDHCHRTGRVRGLLCAAHNRGLGVFAESPDALRAAADYLECHAKDHAEWKRKFMDECDEIYRSTQGKLNGGVVQAGPAAPTAAQNDRDQRTPG